MKGSRLVIIGGLFILLLVGSAIAVPYRYLILSRLNINLGANDSAVGLRQVAEIPLEGGASRFDYQSIDPQRGLLFIAHLGASQVVVFDLKQQKVVAYIPDVAGVHGLIAVPDTGHLYAAATGTARSRLSICRPFKSSRGRTGARTRTGLHTTRRIKRYLCRTSRAAGIL